MAMNSEIKSMYSNQIWKLINLLEGVKPIACKWFYKRKKGVDGKVKTFKVRLVAKDYTQSEGMHYEETFSVISILKSI